MTEATLQIAESIDEITGDGSSGQDPEGSLQAQHDSNAPVPPEAAPEKEEIGQTSKDDDSSRSSKDSESSRTSKDNSSRKDPDPAAEDTAAGDGEKPQNSTGKEKDTQKQKKDTPDIIYYYYTKISKEERLLYDAMLTLAQNFGTGDSGVESRLLDTNPSSDAFAESYTRAYNALVSDHPELFWIAQAKAKFECKYYVLPSFGGKYKVVLSLADDAGGETDEGNGKNVYREEQARMEKAADALLKQVDFSQSDAEIALQLHDLLIESAWYNKKAGEYDYAHTAYGALVEDSGGNSGGALCDGYALAYEYLMQRAGLTCIMVAGYAGSSEGNTEKHAWNLVKLDEDWYEVDATWDDLDFALSPSEDGYDLFLEALSDDDYMNRIRHYMFNLTTDEIRSFTPGDEFTYVSSNGWVTLLQPSVHIRSSADDSEITRDYVTPLAPKAEGTWYTWDMLAGNE